MTVKDLLIRMDENQKVELYDYSTKKRIIGLSKCSYLLGFDLICVFPEDEEIRELLKAEVIKIETNRTFDFIGLLIEKR